MVRQVSWSLSDDPRCCQFYTSESGEREKEGFYGYTFVAGISGLVHAGKYSVAESPPQPLTEAF